MRERDGSFSGGSLVEDGVRQNLADLVVLETILRAAGSDVLVDGEDPGVVASRVADVLLGKNEKEYIPSPGWNQPGGIDYAIGRWFGAGASPEETLVSFMAGFFDELLALADYSVRPGVTSDLWKDQADAIVGQYAMYLAGIGPNTQMIA